LRLQSILSVFSLPTLIFSVQVLNIVVITEKKGLFARWQLDHVTLLDTGNGKECVKAKFSSLSYCSSPLFRYLFPYNKWIAAGSSTEKIAVLPTPPCRYSLSIQTAFGMFSGSSGEIHAILHGRTGQEICMSQPLLLKHQCDDSKLFSRGSLNVFSLLSICDVGELQSVELLNDGSGTIRAKPRSSFKHRL
jgi:hypothetical protein